MSALTAESADRSAIAAERPRYNVAGSADSPVRRPRQQPQGRIYAEREVMQMIRATEEAVAEVMIEYASESRHAVALLQAREALAACQLACEALSALIDEADDKAATPT